MKFCAVTTSGDCAIARATASESERASRFDAGALASELVDVAGPLTGGAGAARVVPLVPVVACAIGAAALGTPGKGASEAPAASAQTGFDDAMAPNPAMTIEARTFTKDLHPMTVDI
jgi:hypothetical protein